jgi:hypothetical protein
LPKEVTFQLRPDKVWGIQTKVLGKQVGRKELAGRVAKSGLWGQSQESGSGSEIDEKLQRW